MRPHAALAALVVAGVLHAPASAVGADLVCQAARALRAGRGQPSPPSFSPRVGLTVGDAFSHGETSTERLLDLEKPAALCTVVGGAADDGTLPLEAYTAAPTNARLTRVAARVHVAQTRLGVRHLRLRAPDRVLFPATWGVDATPPPATPDLRNGARFACYRAKALRGVDPPLRPVRLSLTGGSPTTPAALDVLRPVRLCVPADVNGDDPGAPTRDGGFLCFSTRLPANGSGRHATRGVVATHTLFGPEVLRVSTPYEVCLPAGRPDDTQPTPSITPDGARPTPTPTWSPPPPLPTPTSAIPGLVNVTLDPSAATLRIGESIAFTATGTFEDGSTRDVTEELVWECDFGNEFSCTASNTAGERGHVVARNLDDYGAVTAVDPARAVGGYAFLEVLADPPLLKVHPWGTLIRQFDFDWLTAVRLEHGVYRNATQEVVWSSSDPAIAAATNPPGARSRIDGVGPGMAEIIATDPVTGAVSAPATFIIFGPLNRMEVRAYGGGTSPTGATTIDVGGSAWLTSWGFFDYGFTFERLRGGVEFTSSAPAVAALETIPNPYDPLYTSHRLTGKAVGTTVVSAFDPLSGLRSTEHGCDILVSVRNPALGIRLSPDVRRAGLDETIRLTALGVAVDGTTRNLTQRVTYTSSDPAVVEAPNAWGDRSAVRTVGPGTAIITAVENWPPYGTPPLTTNPLWSATIVVRNERADRIVIEPPLRHTVRYTLPRFVARGHYPSGMSNPVTDSVTWTTTDPDVAAQDPWRRTRLSVANVGTVRVTATLPSGVSSHDTGDDATLVVEEPDALTVTPSTTTLAVGETVTFTALAHLPSSGTIDLLDREITTDARWAPVYFLSDAPGVARSSLCDTSDYLVPGQPLVAFAPGTATVQAVTSATEPPLASSASGGDATVTVTP